MRPEVSLIVGVKNRAQHLDRTLPFMLSQVGIPYELILVNFFSVDNFEEVFKSHLNMMVGIAPRDLQEVRVINIKENLQYNPRKVKNLGARVSRSSGSYMLAFSDADTFLSMDYLSHWCKRVKYEETFFVTRVQESMAHQSKRISPEVNYGNIIVYNSDFASIGGWDEKVSHYGGDDDDLFHRLKLMGLREINPADRVDARQFSILHGDELRLQEFEDKSRVDADEAFKTIYSNKDPVNTNNEFFDYENYEVDTYDSRYIHNSNKL